MRRLWRPGAAPSRQRCSTARPAPAAHRNQSNRCPACRRPPPSRPRAGHWCSAARGRRSDRRTGPASRSCAARRVSSTSAKRRCVRRARFCRASTRAAVRAIASLPDAAESSTPREDPLTLAAHIQVERPHASRLHRIHRDPLARQPLRNTAQRARCNSPATDPASDPSRRARRSSSR